MYRQGIFETHVPMYGQTATANSSGVAKVAFEPVSEGYCWYVERYSVHCPTVAAVASVFVTLGATGTAAIDTSYRADYTTAGADAVGDAFHAIYVPPGYRFVVQWTAATSGDICTASIQYARHQLNPMQNMSQQDIQLVNAAHEHGSSPLVESATAGKRAV